MARAKSKAIVWAEYGFALALFGLLRGLPKPAADAAARFATQSLDLLLPKLRRVGRINLAFAFPDLSDQERERIIDGVFRSVARMLVAMARFPDLNRSNIHQWIDYEGLEHYLHAKEAGKGILIATAHLGNWELSAFAHALMTESMHVMVRPLDNPLVDRLVEQRRTSSGNRLISKHDAARGVLRALKANEAVGMLIDQNAVPSEGMFVDFFGRKACASTGFIKLAQHSRAAVVPGFAFWEEPRAKYVLRFYPSIPLTGNLSEDMQRIHWFFERVIREYPDQWMWIHRRWKTRPEGELPFY